MLGTCNGIEDWQRNSNDPWWRSPIGVPGLVFLDPPRRNQNPIIYPYIPTIHSGIQYKSQESKWNDPPQRKHTYTFLIPYCTRLNTFGHHCWFQTWSTLWFQTTCACCNDVIVALSFRAHICCNYKKNMYCSVNCYGFHEQTI